MLRRVVSTMATAALALSVAGCSKEVFAPAEDRINAVYPLNAEVAAWVAKLEAAFKEETPKDRWRAEYIARQKMRALKCAAGFEPSWFDSAEDIRTKVNNPKCFTAFDAEQVLWLRWTLTHLLSTAPPLRDIPAEPPRRISATKTIQAAVFAENAGVALVLSSDSVEVIDLAKDSSILVEQSRPYQFRAAISPNGRVFSAASQVVANSGVRLRDAENGETLVDIVGLRDFQWLDDSTAWIIWDDRRGVEILDLATGQTEPVKGLYSIPTQLTRISADTFLAISGNSMTTLSLENEAGIRKLSVVEQTTMTGRSWSGASSTLTADGKYFVQGPSKLDVTSLPSLTTAVVDLEPFSGLRLSRLQGHELLLTVGLEASGWRSNVQAVFDVENKTFAIVEDELFATPPGRMSAQTVFIPTLARIGVISGSTIRVVDDVKAGLKLGLQPFLQHLREQDAQHMQSQSASARSLDDGLRRDRAEQQATGDLAKIAYDAQVEAIGVYKSALARGRAGQPAGRGAVTVIVRKTPQPIVLVLSAYDPVDWRLVVDPRAQLKAVLVSGYSDSTVQGAGTVRTQTIGRRYAYERGSEQFRALQRDVTASVGKPIDTFQGKYEAATFIVGGE